MQPLSPDLPAPYNGQPTPQLQRIDELGDEIGRLSAHLNAVNCRLLELIVEFDELGGHGDQGARSCAHWLNWKCGFSLNAAREKIRTAKALPKLPKIRACFAAGRISYSKVRAMTRVATPENEDALLNVALHGTASHVERLVRGYRWRIKADEEQADEQRRQDSRFCHYQWDDSGCLIISARLTPEQGALVIKALEAGQTLLEEDVSAVTSDNPAQVPDEPASADSEEPGENVSAETSDKIALWNGRPKRRADALALMAETYLASGAQPMKGGDRHQVLVIADAGVMANASKVGECCLEHGPQLAIASLRRLGCDASRRTIALDEAGEPVNIGRKSRTIPPPMRHAMLLRDGGCRFPGCSQTRFVDGHHIQHWADGGDTSLDNLVTLCRHHHRLVHEGGFKVCRRGPNAFEFTSPRGNVIAGAAPPEEPVRDLDVDVSLLNLQMDLQIDDTTLGLWDGEQMDYSEAIEGLQELDGRLVH